MGDQPATDERADHECDARPGRPRSDRRAALLAAEGRRDHGEPCRGEDRARDSLQAACQDQDRPVGSRRTEHRHDAEEDDAEHEHAALAEEVAERPADEQEGAEGEQVGVDDPLLEREPAAEIALDRREGNVDDAPVDEDDARA